MRWICLCACLLGSAGCGGGGQDPWTATSGTLQARFSPEPNPPRVGHDSSFVVTLTEGGAPVTGARVHLALSFKSLNQAGPTADLNESGPGRYQAMDLSTGMNGRWTADVTVQRANAPETRFAFPFTVSK